MRKRNFAILAAIGLQALTTNALPFDATKEYTPEEATFNNDYYNDKGNKIWKVLESKGFDNYKMDSVELATSNSFKEQFLKEWRNSDLSDYASVSEQEVLDILKNTKIFMMEEDAWLNFKKIGGGQSKDAIVIVRKKVNPDDKEALKKSKEEYLSAVRHEMMHRLGFGEDMDAVHLEQRLSKQNGAPISDVSTEYLQQENVTQGIISVVGSKDYFKCKRMANGEQELKKLFEAKQNIVGYDVVRDYDTLAMREDFTYYANEKMEFFQNEGDVANGDLRFVKLLKDVANAKTPQEKDALAEQYQKQGKEMYSTYNFALGLPYGCYEVPDCDFGKWQEVTFACNKYMNAKRQGLVGDKELDEANKIVGGFIEDIAKDGDELQLKRLAEFVDRYSANILGKERMPREMDPFGFGTYNLSLTDMYKKSVGDDSASIPEDTIQKYSRASISKVSDARWKEIWDNTKAKADSYATERNRAWEAINGEKVLEWARGNFGKIADQLKKSHEYKPYTQDLMRSIRGERFAPDSVVRKAITKGAAKTPQRRYQGRAKF